MSYGVAHGVFSSARQRLVVLTFKSREEAEEWDAMVDEERWLKLVDVELKEIATYDLEAASAV